LAALNQALVNRLNVARLNVFIANMACGMNARQPCKVIYRKWFRPIPLIPLFVSCQSICRRCLSGAIITVELSVLAMAVAMSVDWLWCCCGFMVLRP